MLHIATVHWKSDKWVDIQLRYLNTHITQPFKIYAFLNDVPGNHRSKYFYSSTDPVGLHPVKLNLLADMAVFHARDPGDLLMFIDGDAFPIGDIMTFGCEQLRKYPLVAVQRLENAGDRQPHPCFCLTTVGFWKEIQGDWKRGYLWKNRYGAKVTDVGGNLLKKLEDRGVEWYPMLRSNRRNLHPVFFALYSDLIYHHGAGFREPASRSDLFDRISLVSVTRSALRLVNLGLAKRVYEKMLTRDARHRGRAELSERVFESIQKDPDFYRFFQEPEKDQESPLQLPV
jgi:hypothetical protein